MDQPKRAALITFEGGEGSGKSTQLQLAAEALRMRGFSCTTTREPGGTPTGERIRDILLHDQQLHIEPLTEFLLMSAARAQHTADVIRPALRRGAVVLCDRYADASTAYQGFGRQLPLDLVEQVNAIAMLGVTPDLTLLLDLSVDQAFSRVQQRARNTQPQDRIEAADRAFHQRVRDGYRRLAAAQPERFAIIDGAQSIDQMHRQVMQRILHCLEGATMVAE